VRLFVSRFNPLNFRSLESERGIVPENRLYDRSKCLNLGTVSGSEPGICPEKEFDDKSSHLIHLQLRINWGKVPSRLLLLKDKNFKLGIGKNLADSGLNEWLLPRSRWAIIGSLLSW
jgi:hypothetical protein